MYGEIYDNNATGQVISLVFTNYIGLNAVGQVSGTTVPPAGNEIIVNTTNVYKVSFSVSFTTNSDATTPVEFAIGVNQIPVNNVVALVSAPANTESVAAAFGLLVLQRLDVVTVMVKSTAGSVTLFPSAGDLFISG